MGVMILHDLFRHSHGLPTGGATRHTWQSPAVLSVTLATALAAATGYRLVAAIPRPTTVAAMERPAHIDLSIDRHLRVPKTLAIHWDPNSPYLHDAQKAILLVEDGNRESRYKLDREQLTKGNLRYARASSSVKIVMEVSAETGQTARGVLTVVDPSR